MDLITYITGLIKERQMNVEPIKLIEKPTTTPTLTTTVTPEVKPVEQEKVEPIKSNPFVPKEMHWLNWENTGFRNALLDSQIKIESGVNPNARSNAKDGGALGLAQFMRTTWNDAKKNGWIDQAAERTDPVASLKAQKALMNDLYNKPEMKSSLTEEERYAKTLAAYNTGYGNLRKAITKANTKGGNWFDYVSHETQKYVPMIMKKTEEEYFKNNEDYISKYDRGDVS